jgi:hypothetical protein
MGLDDLTAGGYRSASVVRLGVALVVAFFVPLLGLKPDFGATVDFPNIERLGSVGLGGQIVGVYPLLAGLALIALGYATSGQLRGWLLIGIGLAPIAVTAVSPEANADLWRPQIADQRITWAPVVSGVGFASFVVYLAWCALYAGGRTCHYRPNRLIGPIVGTIGGGILLLAIMVPGRAETVEAPSHLLAPIRYLKSDGFGLIGFVLSLNLLLWVTASLVCMLGFAQRDTVGNLGDWSYLAIRVSFGLLVVALALYLMKPYAPVMERAIRESRRLPGFAAIMHRLSVGTSCASGVVKNAALAGGILLVMPMGIAELIISLSEPRFEPERAERQPRPGATQGAGAQPPPLQPRVPQPPSGQQAPRPAATSRRGPSQPRQPGPLPQRPPPPQQPPKQNPYL